MADGQHGFANALAIRLQQEGDIEVVAVESSAAGADAVVRAAAVDVVVTDLALEESGAERLLETFLRWQPHVRTVVLSAIEDPSVVVGALRRGACAYLSKDVTVDELLAAIRGSVEGETHVSPRLLTGVMARLLSPAEPTAQERRVQALTARERDVLERMVGGMSPTAIARQLLVSTSTVRTHAQRVRAKLGVHSTLEAVSVARRAGVRPRRPA